MIMSNIYDILSNLIPVQDFIKFRENGEFLILMSEKLEIQYLNEVAKDFYLLINGKRSLKEITEILLEMYDVERNILEKDICQLLRDLQWKNLIILKEKKNEKVY